MKIDHLLFQIAVAMLFLCSLSLGGLDQSGNIGAVNMTASEFRAEVPSSNLQESLVDTGAPEATSTYVGTENAVFTKEAPPEGELKMLMPSSLLASPPGYMYYNGDYLAWSDFSAIFPSDKPGLWIERAVSWTFYATLPWGSWTRELIYVPQASPVTMYESYPGGYILGYNMGVVSLATTTSGTTQMHSDGTAASSLPTPDTAMPWWSTSILEPIIANPIRQSPARKRSVRANPTATG